MKGSLDFLATEKEVLVQSYPVNLQMVLNQSKN
jgi:hypothetical protein